MAPKALTPRNYSTNTVLTMLNIPTAYRQYFTDESVDYLPSLEWLVTLRTIAIISQLIVLSIVILGLEYRMNFIPFLCVSGMLAVINTFIYWRIKKGWEVSAAEVAINLLIDLLALALLLYFSGGSTNPLVSLFIIPVALSAVFLPVIYIVGVVALTIFLYTFLMQWYTPLPSIGSRFGGDFNLHIIGMYGNFIFSAIIITIFVSKLVNNGRRQERELANVREKLSRNKHVTATSLLAAHAVHKINTPLATISLLVGEVLINSDVSNDQNIKDLSEIKKQVSYCKGQLQTLQRKVSVMDDESEPQPLSLEQGIISTVKAWRKSHPEIQLKMDIQLNKNTPFTEINILTQTLINLIDNAAESSLQAKHPQVTIHAQYASGSCDQLIIDINDFGEGLTQQQLDRVGKRPYSSKPDGMGVGLLLSHSSLEHLGGEIRLTDHNDSPSGIRTRIILPLIKG